MNWKLACAELSVTAGGGSTLAGMTADDDVRAHLLAAVIRLLPVDDELRTGLETGVTEQLAALAWRRWKFRGGVGSDQDHAIAVSVQTCFDRGDPALACRYLVEDAWCHDLVVILAMTRTAEEAVEGARLVGM